MKQGSSDWNVSAGSRGKPQRQASGSLTSIQPIGFAEVDGSFISEILKEGAMINGLPVESRVRPQVQTSQYCDNHATHKVSSKWHTQFSINFAQISRKRQAIISCKTPT